MGTSLIYGHAFCRRSSEFYHRGARVVREDDAQRGDARVGVIGRMGNIAQGTTVSDYHVSEKQHQISALTLRVGSFG